MGASLGPVLANIIMTELEKKLLPKLLDDDVIKFYVRYVDDTLVLIKEDQIESVLQKFNSFDKNLEFTVDTFEDGHIHFLDLSVNIDNGEVDVYSKPTNTGQYAHYTSYAPWSHKVAWARALFNRAKRICSTPTLFRSQKSRINKILSWNGFPTFCRRKLLKGFEEDHARKARSTPEMGLIQEEDDNENKDLTFTLKIPYMGKTGDSLARTLKRKIRQNLSKNVRLRIIFTTNKISKFCSVKDRIPDSQKKGIIYLVKCPGCGDSYVGKTECCFEKRLDEHAKLNHQPMNQHFNSCSEFKYIANLFNLPDSCTDTADPPGSARTCPNRRPDGRNDDSTPSRAAFFFETLRTNSKVLATANDWLTLAYLEPLLAKKHGARINHGEMAMRTLNLF